MGAGGDSSRQSYLFAWGVSRTIRFWLQRNLHWLEQVRHPHCLFCAFLCLLAVNLAFDNEAGKRLYYFPFSHFFYKFILHGPAETKFFSYCSCYWHYTQIKQSKRVFFLVRQSRDTMYHGRICQHDVPACLYFCSLLVVHLKLDYNWLVPAFKLLHATLHPLAY